MANNKNKIMEGTKETVALKNSSSTEGVLRELLRESRESSENLINTFYQEWESDDESFKKKARQLAKAILDKDADGILIALCGWSTQSLLKKARLMRDEDAEFYQEPENAIFVMVDINDNRYLHRCKVNMQTFEVYDIDPDACDVLRSSPDAELHESDEIVEEYLVMDDIPFPVAPEDEAKSKCSVFWYGENE